MTMQKYEMIIEDLWHNYDSLEVNSREYLVAKEKLSLIINELDQGTLKVCYKQDGEWVFNSWLKKAILLFFKSVQNQRILAGDLMWFDKIAQKYTANQWDQEDFGSNLIRMVPGSYVRHGAYIGKNVILMPSFVNIGAHVGDNTMIDTWSTVGSCAYVGANCHISGGVGIGGVLEPIQARPVIIEDNCFIGARSEIAEGVIVGEGSVISMGVFIGASTKIVDRQTGQITTGYIPPRSVVVSGSLPNKNNIDAPSLYCAVIVKTVDSSTLSKTAINEILRGI